MNVHVDKTGGDNQAGGIELLGARGSSFNLTQPWHYFWLTGGLSSFLDNAPTYLTFATVAAGPVDDFSSLVEKKESILKAISCWAVLMGALSYIGNGPNFMVKAMAEGMGYRMPSFFGYLAWSAGVLLPIFALVTWLFFL